MVDSTESLKTLSPLKPESSVAELVVYSRRGCHLCEQLLGELEPLVSRRAVVRVVDIDTSPNLQQTYGDKVPVVEGDGTELCRYRLDKRAIADWLKSR